MKVEQKGTRDRTEMKWARSDGHVGWLWKKEKLHENC